MIDMGYGISDYRSVNPIYGTMQDMEELIEDCQKRGIKVLLDLVVNHTMDKHSWFMRSKMSREGEFANYYIWGTLSTTKKETGRSRTIGVRGLVVALGNGWKRDSNTIYACL